MNKMEDSEWRNFCVGCGHLKITHGAELPGICPECKDSRWLCHQIIPDNPQDPPTGSDNFTDFGEIASTDKNLLKKETPSPITTSKDRVEQFCHPKTSPAVPPEAIPGGFPPPLTEEELSQGIKKSGRPNRDLPVSEIIKLEGQGKGCKMIAEELNRRGVSDASYRTVARFLHKRRQGALI